MVRNRPMGRPGFTRTTGFYGRFGLAAVRMGNTPELKFLDTTQTFDIDATQEIPATGGQLALIPQGDTESTRDGRECVIKSIAIKWVITLTPAAAATASGTTVIYLILDKQCNGVAATLTDVFTGGALKGFMNLANSSRFEVLKKWVLNWNPNAGGTTAFNTQTKFVDYYKACNIKMQFSNTDGAITGIRSNNIFIMAASTAGIDDLVGVSGTSRVRFLG